MKKGFVYTGAAFLLSATIFIAYAYLMWSANILDESIPRIMEIDAANDFSNDVLRALFVSKDSAFSDALQDSAAYALSFDSAGLCSIGKVSHDGLNILENDGEPTEGCCMYTYNKTPCERASIVINPEHQKIGQERIQSACVVLNDTQIDFIVNLYIQEYAAATVAELAHSSNFIIGDLEIETNIIDNEIHPDFCGFEVEVSGYFTITDIQQTIKKTMPFNISKGLTVKLYTERGQTLMQETKNDPAQCSQSTRVNYTEAREFASIQITNQLGQTEYGNGREGLFHLDSFVYNEIECLDDVVADGMLCMDTQPFCNDLS